MTFTAEKTKQQKTTTTTKQEVAFPCMEVSFFLLRQDTCHFHFYQNKAKVNNLFLITFFLSLLLFYHSKRFTTITPPGATRKPLTFLEGRLGLTTMKRSFPPTGTHPSPRSASVWRSVSRSGLLSSTSRRTPCTLWSLMGSTATPHWVVTSGSHWLVLGPHCRKTVTRKGSMLMVQVGMTSPK